MDKVIKLNGEELPLSAKAMNMVIYRSQFKSDIMESIGQIVRLGQTNDYEKIDSLAIARLVWTMAKTKDPDFPDFEKWFEELEIFPVMDVLNDIIELVMANLTSTTTIQPKNRKRAVK